VPLVAGSVNRGSSVVGAGLVVNDWMAVTGMSCVISGLNYVDVDADIVLYRSRYYGNGAFSCGVRLPVRRGYGSWSDQHNEQGDNGGVFLLDTFIWHRVYVYLSHELMRTWRWDSRY